MWAVNNFNYLHILVLSDVARYYKPTKSRNYTGTLFIAYTIEYLASIKYLHGWPIIVPLLICFFYLLQLSIISLRSAKNHTSSFVYYLLYVKMKIYF